MIHQNRDSMATPIVISIPMTNPRLQLTGKLELSRAAQTSGIMIAHRYPSGARHLTGASCLLDPTAAAQLYAALGKFLETL